METEEIILDESTADLLEIVSTYKGKISELIKKIGLTKNDFMKFVAENDINDKDGVNEIIKNIELNKIVIKEKPNLRPKIVGLQEKFIKRKDKKDKKLNSIFMAIQNYEMPNNCFVAVLKKEEGKSVIIDTEYEKAAIRANKINKVKNLTYYVTITPEEKGHNYVTTKIGEIMGIKTDEAKKIFAGSQLISVATGDRAKALDLKSILAKTGAKVVINREKMARYESNARNMAIRRRRNIT